MNGQLARRNQRIHLQRYRNTTLGREEFRKFLAVVDRDLGEYFDFSLEKHDEETYRGCVGLVGLLRNWLVKASIGSERARFAQIKKSIL